MSEPTTPIRFRCIVAATDFSPASERAIAWAAQLAAHRHAELRLVHAVAWSEAPDTLRDTTNTTMAELVGAARDRLAELARRLCARVPSIVWTALPGPSVEVILDEAETHQAELLVLGTRGLRGWRHVLLGSTAQRVIAAAACPVLAVHGDDPPPSEGPWRWLAGTDGSADAGQAVRAAAHLLAPATTEITLLRAFDEPIFYSTAETASCYQLIEVVRNAAAEQLQREAHGLAEEGIETHPILRPGFPAEIIVSTAAELHADLIVLGTRGRNGFAHLLLGSTAERVVQRAEVPVLVVPHRAGPALQLAEQALAIVGAPMDEQC